MSEKEKTAQWNKKEEVVIPTKWTQIKNIAQKRVLQDIYISSLVKKYNLNRKEQIQLQHIVNEGIIMLAFSEIKLNSMGRIEEFVGLQWNPEKRIFFINKPKSKSRKTNYSDHNIYDENNEHHLQSNFFLNHWIKFIKSISKVDKSLQKSIYDKLSSSVNLTPLVV